MAYPQTSFNAVDVAPDSLIGRRREVVAKNTLLYQLDVLKQTGRYDAFKLEWHSSYSDPPNVWPIPNHLFWDSDVAKWLEGACYFLKQRHLPAIDHAIKELVDMIRSAQQPDGYLNIHYTVVEPGKRFTNLRDMHELYNAGHLIEAALAHNDLYGNDLLLEPMVRYVDLLCRTFGPGEDQLHGYPGHPEIELALLRLYERTGTRKHFDLAKYFITERGNATGADSRHYYDVEAEKRGEDPAKRPAYYPEPRSLWYHQAHLPIVEQPTIEGHSVRAMYLLTAVADLVRMEGLNADVKLKQSLYRLWDNMVERKMYVTGGIGAMKQWEGFGLDYFLPQGTDEGGCYSETCAAIGVMMLAERILQFDRDSRFADITELCLYNAVLTAMSYDGKAFTYVNQLASSDTDPSTREEWFTCACCPPNTLRLLAQIGGYIWTRTYDEGSDAADVAVNLYIPSTFDCKTSKGNARISQSSNWPWDETIKFDCHSIAAPLKLSLRIPDWAQSSYSLEPACPSATIQKGYLTLPADWLNANPSFTLTLPLKPRWVAQHPYTNQNTLSLARGPVIYCLEDVDHPWVNDHFKGTFVDANARISESEEVDETTGDRYHSLTLCRGGHVLDETKLKSAPFAESGQLQSTMCSNSEPRDLHFVPYYFRANRTGRGQMRVGLKRWDNTESSANQPIGSKL